MSWSDACTNTNRMYLSFFLTGKSSFDDKRKGVASDIDDYIAKPVNYEKLLWRIKTLLHRANINASQRIMIPSP